MLNGENLMEIFERQMGAGFRFVDKVVKIDGEAGTIITTFDYSLEGESKPFLHDHFLGRPAMPLSLIIEMMAQTCGLFVASVLGNGKCFVVRYDKCQSGSELVTPPVQLVITANLLKRWGRGTRSIWKFFVMVETNQAKSVGQGEITLFAGVSSSRSSEELQDEIRD